MPVGSYSVELTRSAERDLARVGDKRTRARIVEKLRSLEEEPRPQGCERLAGGQGRHRVRQGDYRILYEIHDRIRVVAVVKIGHRREVYR